MDPEEQTSPPLPDKVMENLPSHANFKSSQTDLLKMAPYSVLLQTLRIDCVLYTQL